MEPKSIKLKNDAILTIREAAKEDAARVIAFVNRTAGETDFFTFGCNEFYLSLEQEEQFIENHLNSDNKFFALALIEQELAGLIVFTGGDRSNCQETLHYETVFFTLFRARQSLNGRLHHF